MVVGQIRQTLEEKSNKHKEHLSKLGQEAVDEPLPPNLHILDQINQIKGMCTIIQDSATTDVDFNFYFDRLSAILVQHALEHMHFTSAIVETPQGNTYHGLKASADVSAVVILR